MIFQVCKRIWKFCYCKTINMKEQLISFDTAKLAKEKGLNMYSQYAYKLNGNNCIYNYNPNRNKSKKQFANDTKDNTS